MSRSYLPSWARPTEAEVNKVLDEFSISEPAHRDDAYSMAEELCLVRDELHEAKKKLDDL